MYARTTKRRRIGVPNKTGTRVPVYSRRACGPCPRGAWIVHPPATALDQWRPAAPTAVERAEVSLRPRPPPPVFRPIPTPVVETPRRRPPVYDIIILLLLYTILFLLYNSHTRKSALGLFGFLCF